MAHLPSIKTRVALHAHRQVRGLLEGEYAATQAGRSMDFNDLRDYVRGDDVKDIDWKSSARARTLLVKRFTAVRKHTVLIVVSTGRSMAAHLDVGVPKRELAVFVTGVVGLLAVRHGDQVALAHGDADGQQLTPARSGELNLERALAGVHESITLDSAPSDLTALLGFVARTVRRRTILLVVCDETALDDSAAAALRRLVVQHETLMVTFGDLDPTSVPTSAGSSRDIEHDRRLADWVRQDPVLARDYAAAVAIEQAELRQRLDALGVVHEHVQDHTGALAAVFRLLERHRHARRR